VLKSFFGEPPYSIVEVCRVDLSSVSLAPEITRSSTRGEEAAERLPNNVAFVTGRFDNHRHQVEGLLIQMDGFPRIAVKFEALRTM
jgi:hypothetical protein